MRYQEAKSLKHPGMSDVFSVSGTLSRGRYAMAVFLKILPLALIANAIVI